MLEVSDAKDHSNNPPQSPLRRNTPKQHSDGGMSVVRGGNGGGEVITHSCQ